MTTVAVIGIGQSFRGDDAAGLEAIRLWESQFPETAHRSEVRVEASELPGLSLLDKLEDVDAAILVDAVQSLKEPGKIHILGESDLMSFASDSKSAHGWGVAETLRMMHLTQEKNPKILLIGIEVNQTDIGAAISQKVQAKLPEVCKIIQQTVLETLFA